MAGRGGRYSLSFSQVSFRHPGCQRDRPDSGLDSCLGDISHDGEELLRRGEPSTQQGQPGSQPPGHEARGDEAHSCQARLPRHGHVHLGPYLLIR